MIDWEAIARGVLRKVERETDDPRVRDLAQQTRESMEASKAAGVKGPLPQEEKHHHDDHEG